MSSKKECKFQEISLDDFINHGVKPEGRSYNTGEEGYALYLKDGSGSILKITGASGWHKCHYHTRFTEAYLTLSHKIILAYFMPENDVPKIITLRAGESYSVPPMVVHGVYAPEDSVYLIGRAASRFGKGNDRVDCTRYDEILREVQL